MIKLSSLPVIAAGGLLGVCFVVAIGPVRGQVFNDRPAIAFSGSASVEARAAKMRSARTTLYNLVMTGDRPESVSATSFGSGAACRQARDVQAENLIFLGVNDQTKRQVYVWCDWPKAARRRNGAR